eukprot:scaffold663539_cov43-Prasinocladus_malaysianus.AAC.1
MGQTRKTHDTRSQPCHDTHVTDRPADHGSRWMIHANTEEYRFVTDILRFREARLTSGNVFVAAATPSQHNLQARRRTLVVSFALTSALLHLSQCRLCAPPPPSRACP